MAGLIRRAPHAFFSFLEELLQGPADETHDKKDDILMFMMLEELMKNCRNAEVRTESYVERIVPAVRFVLSPALRTFETDGPKACQHFGNLPGDETTIKHFSGFKIFCST